MNCVITLRHVRHTAENSITEFSTQPEACAQARPAVFNW